MIDMNDNIYIIIRMAIFIWKILLIWWYEWQYWYNDNIFFGTEIWIY